MEESPISVQCQRASKSPEILEKDVRESTVTMCVICKTTESIYRCPKCLARTCGLSCCLLHKEQTGCDGKRDRTAFLPLHKFTDSVLTSDYYFLEDVLNKSDRGKRLVRNMGLDKHQHGGKKRKFDANNSADESVPLHPLSQLDKDQQSLLQHEDADDERKVELKSLVPVLGDVLSGDRNLKYPKHTQRLVQKAKERCINLLLMPPGMQRHLSNKSTKYDVKKDIIYWKVEFIFHRIGERDKEHNTAVLTLERLSENEDVSLHLRRAIDRNVVHSGPSNYKRSILKEFMKSQYSGLIKRVPCSSSRPMYNRVSLCSSLGDILKGTSVIEFPTIEIVMEKDENHFPLMIKEFS